jgi:Leucine-rich repeat (LRR) protein
VYEGFIQTDQQQKIEIELHFLVLLDSTLIGAYHYQPQNGDLKLVGRLNKDNSFILAERDKKDSITGFFKGKVSSDKSKASGQWTNPGKDKKFHFELNLVTGNSYWNIIRKNRGLYEYKDLKQAIKEKEKVLSIDAADQGINTLPQELESLKKIVSINLLANNFTIFPVVLTRLTTLDELSLSSNKLTYIGAEIGALKNLKILYLNFNRLKSLPKEIGALTNLLYLDLGDNELTSLPEEIKQLTSLQELYLNRNKLSAAEQKRIQKLLPGCIIHF